FDRLRKVESSSLLALLAPRPGAARGGFLLTLSRRRAAGGGRMSDRPRRERNEVPSAAMVARGAFGD
ncbi:MAG: hypothetical protein MUE73_03585, partial [Planctomycetes bacterium]|nr:hypothetical protein [Planctomycetota bacterium]